VGNLLTAVGILISAAFGGVTLRVVLRKDRLDVAAADRATQSARAQELEDAKAAGRAEAERNQEFKELQEKVKRMQQGGQP
jgi:hypothetical protein